MDQIQRRIPLSLAAILLTLAPEVTSQKILHDQTALLRRSPKHFVMVVRIDAAQRSLDLRIEGKKKNDTRTYALEPDAEVRIRGSWGRLDQLTAGDRAWIWMHPSKKGRPGGIFVIADEISEQAIHGLPYEVTGANVDEQRVFLRRKYGRKTEQKRELELHESLRLVAAGDGFVFSNSSGDTSVQPKTDIKTGDFVYVQTTDGKIRLLLSREGAAVLRLAQIRSLNADFRADGLPASVAASHPFAGDLEIMVDHAGKRWARHQKAGVEVTLMLEKPIQGILRAVEGWHEKTRLRIAMNGPALASVRAGQRLRVKVTEPPSEVLESDLPVGIGRAQGRSERIAWFFANTYCSCSIMGDGCTGMFYTLASCHQTRCGMPKRIRTFVGERIDKGMTDAEILGELRKSRGPLCLKSHLLR